MAKKEVITITEKQFAEAGAEIIAELSQKANQDGHPMVGFSMLMTGTMILGVLSNKLFAGEDALEEMAETQDSDRNRTQP